MAQSISATACLCMTKTRNSEISKILILLLLTTFVLQGCLSFRYSVKASTGGTDRSNTVKEAHVVRVPARDSDKIICYLTVWIYGGYCWFISPNEDSDRRALEKARGLFDEQPKSLSVEYVGRD